MTIDGINCAFCNRPARWMLTNPEASARLYCCHYDLAEGVGGFHAPNSNLPVVVIPVR